MLSTVSKSVSMALAPLWGFMCVLRSAPRQMVAVKVMTGSRKEVGDHVGMCHSGTTNSQLV